MASLKCRSGIYYGQWSDASRTPNLRRHSLRTRIRRTAQTLLEKADDTYKRGEWDPWTDPVSVLDSRPKDPIKMGVAVEEYLAARQHDLKPITFENYTSMLWRFAGEVGEGKAFARLGVDDVARFTRASEVAVTTMRTRLAVLRAFCAWGVTEGHLKESPAQRVSTPAPPPRLPKAVRESDLALIIEAVRDDQRRRDESEDSRVHTDRLWLIPCFEFAAVTGFRAAELSRLTWGDVAAESNVVRLETQKSGKAGTAPLTSAARRVLATVGGDRDPNNYVFCPPCSYGMSRNVRAFATNLNRYFREYVRAAGIERRLTLHGLRHGFCTRLAESGASAFVIAAAARHGSVTTSQRYVSIANESLKAQLDVVFK